MKNQLVKLLDAQRAPCKSAGLLSGAIIRFNHSTVQRFNDLSRLIPALALGLGVLATTGCQVFTYTSPTGERFTRSSLGANTSIQSLAIEAGTNGVRRVELRGYDNETSQSLGAVTEAAVKAAIQSAK